MPKIKNSFAGRCRWLHRLAILGTSALASAGVVADAAEKYQGSTGLPAAPITDADYYEAGAPSAAKVKLGQALFFDKILSGNRDIACATCHHPNHATTDGVSLGLGTGASGLGPKRSAGPDQPVFGRVPRNSPSLFNRGAHEFSALFHDGRVEHDAEIDWPGGFSTPARDKLPEGLDSVLAAQAMFPVISAIEMAGQPGQNEIADAIATKRVGGPDGAWDRIARRVRDVPEYVNLFRAAYPELVSSREITFVHVANAIAAFEAKAFRADASPFDLFLRTGDVSVLEEDARRGMELFYGDAGCSGCHSGSFQTDQAFHAVAMPQIGPGKGDGSDDSYWRATGFPVRLEDFGRERVTQDPADRYKFRTPSLRNVELTGPWGHDGTYRTLEAVIRHMLDPVVRLEAYSPDEAFLSVPASVLATSGKGSSLRFDPINPRRLADYRKRDVWVQTSDSLRGGIAAANELPSRPGSEAWVQDLVAFLRALTDPTSRQLGHLVPATVPSGLPVAD
jgi:cytochrome c peroxidase